MKMGSARLVKFQVGEKLFSKMYSEKVLKTLSTPSYM